MTAAEILDSAADLLSEEGRWCQGAAALTKEGRFCRPEDPEAASWCALGAIRRVSDVDIFDPVPANALAFLRDQTSFYLPSWNDVPERTREEVVAALRRAAERAR